MPNPLEFLFSLYFVQSPPFLARLNQEEVAFTERLKLSRYRKADGTVVLFDVTKKDRSDRRIPRADNLRGLRFFLPSQDFGSFLLNELDGHFIYMGGYQWKWSGGGEHLIAYDGASSFVLEKSEAKLLADIILRSQS